MRNDLGTMADSARKSTKFNCVCCEGERGTFLLGLKASKLFYTARPGINKDGYSSNKKPQSLNYTNSALPPPSNLLLSLVIASFPAFRTVKLAVFGKANFQISVA